MKPITITFTEEQKIEREAVRAMFSNIRERTPLLTEQDWAGFFIGVRFALTLVESAGIPVVELLDERTVTETGVTPL